MRGGAGVRNVAPRHGLRGSDRVWSDVTGMRCERRWGEDGEAGDGDGDGGASHQGAT